MSEKLQEDMRRLRRMLENTAGRDADFVQRIARGEDVQVLDLACGRCDEAETLTRFLADIREAHQPLSLPGKGRKPRRRSPGKKSLKLTGLDIRAREIADASARFQKREDEESGAEIDFEFIHGDGVKLNSHKEMTDQFDVIFMRHQNLWNGKSTWEEIYHQALEKLSPNGRLIITSYFDGEHAQALEAIRNQGGELITTLKNPTSRQLPTAGKSVDRHVAVLKRQA